MSNGAGLPASAAPGSPPWPARPPGARRGRPSGRPAVPAALAALPAGAAPVPADLRAVLAWQTPRRVGRNGAAAGYDAVLTEAATLGLTGLNALTGYGRLLAAEVAEASRTDPDQDPLGLQEPDAPTSAAVAALDALLPAPVDHV